MSGKWNTCVTEAKKNREANFLNEKSLFDWIWKMGTKNI